jgi:DNA-cytosine methyltransferase
LDTPNKGKLFFQLLRILRHSQPKVFVFENVKGLLHLDGGAHFNTIVSLLQDSGYNVTHGVVDTSWFLPQRRERVFFVGIRKDLLDDSDALNYVAFVPCELKRRYQIYGNDVAENCDRFDKVLLKNQDAGQRNNEYSSILPPSRLGDILENEQTVLSDSPHTYLSPHQWSKISAQSYTQIHSDGSGQLVTRDDTCAQTLVSSYRQSYLMHSQFVVPSDSLYLRRQNEQLLIEARKRRGIPCETTDSTYTNDGSSIRSNALVDIGGNQTLPRFFTPRECCRLQGFPEKFVLPFNPLISTTCNKQTWNNINQRQQRQYISKFYRQIGNSVSPPCVIAVVKDAIDRFVLNRQQFCTKVTMVNPVFDAVRMANPYPERVFDLMERKLAR